MSPSKLHSGRGVMWLALAGWGLVAAVGQAGCADSQPNESILLPDGGPAGDGGNRDGGFIGAGGVSAGGGAAGLGGSAAAAGAAGAPPAPAVTFTGTMND